ncbi:DNA cytosine methyltransferase [Echinicola strongylocentroti]|uniref:DNA cytosine methyltransferase n=1 Tax=Echinicola strongylocentroti TaxID=1795355 RepID=UPI0013A6E73E|nr:DNA cytosine methyltransferase [Echinicola strongylocentroti]
MTREALINFSSSKSLSRLYVDSRGKLCFDEEPKFFYIDLFCGAGGVSSGIVRGGGKVIYCINHDPLAIASHRANLPGVFHATEDIRTFNLTPLIRVVEFIRKKNPGAFICLWASLECTHFSKAKGGEHREADSRTLAEHLYRYIDALDPDYIDIENVVEFMSWGPLRMKCAKMHKHKCDLSFDSRFAYQYEKKKRGKKKRIACEEYHPDRCELKMKHIPHYKMVPKSRDKGRDYVRWFQDICERFGYDYDYRILNSADYGAVTARTRYFGQFKKPFLPFTWPKATHAKNPKNEGLFGSLKPWKAVRPMLDLEDVGRSIFGRKKELSENTLKRIYAGLVKYVAEGKEPEFIMKYLSNALKTGISNPVDLDNVAPTVTTQNRLAFVNAQFIAKHFSGKPHQKVHPLSEPARTITTSANQSLVSTEFLLKYHGTGDNVLPMSGPSSTITTKDRMAVIWLDKQFRSELNHQDIDRPAGAIMTNDKHCKMTAVWVDKHYSGKHNHQSADMPLGSILTKDKYANIQCFVMNQFSGGGQHSSVDKPLGAITTVPKSNVIQAERFLFNHNYSNGATDIDSPAPTLLASRKHYYLLNPQYQSKGGDIDRPCFTLIARMDKMPPYLMEADKGEGDAAIIIYEDDCETMKKIKLFMAIHGICDIKMRMLKVPELLRIQGFGDKYILKGTQTDQKRFIGNSVEVNLAKSKVAERIRVFQEMYRQYQNQHVA